MGTIFENPIVKDPPEKKVAYAQIRIRSAVSTRHPCERATARYFRNKIARQPQRTLGSNHNYH